MRDARRSNSRGRLVVFGLSLFLPAALIGSAACSLVVDSTSTQCSKDTDCAHFGPGMTCSGQGVCVASAVDAGGDQNVAEAAAVDPVLELKAGHYHSCVRRESGTVWCWGKNESGQVGDGSDPAVEPIVTSPHKVAGVDNAAEISSGEDHSCVRRTDGAVLCWGSNVDGQLGLGTLDPSKTPVTVQLPGKAKSVANGASFTCAVIEDGTVYCWGSNSKGQMGNGKTPTDILRSPTPVQVTGLTTAVSVACGQEHACALLADGTLSCWGANDTEQLGMPATDAAGPDMSTTPVKVDVLSDVRIVALGEKHSCATLGNKDTYCWGENAHGQLGLPLTTDGTTTPTLVDPIAGGATALSAGGDHVCAQLKDGSLVCWGSNEHMELGRDATVAQSEVPLELNGVGASRLVSAGDEHTCALLLTGKVVCFGQNKQGQCGDGLKEDITSTPVEVVGLP